MNEPATFGPAIQRKAAGQAAANGGPLTDPATGLIVIRDASGSFPSGWKLSIQELQHVLTTGKLGGD